MHLSWLEDLTTLAACRNFSRAAELRNVTQPAFSRRIRALEQWVGTRLFDRDTHRIELTPAGETFRHVAAETLRRLQQGRREALDAESSAASLRFASTHALSLTFFPEWLRGIDEALSSSTIRLIADTMQGCERTMMEGQAHFLLCHRHPAAFSRLAMEDFLAVQVGEDMLVPVSALGRDGAPQHVLPGTPERPVPYLAFSEESGMGRIFAAERAQSGRVCSLKPVFSSHMAILLKMFAAQGRGLAWCPQSLVADDLGTSLSRAGDSGWDIPLEIWLFRPRTRLAAQAEAFWALLRERLPDYPPTRRAG